MTEDQLRQRIDEIVAECSDDEMAHLHEDQLHVELIRQFCPDWVVAEVERPSRAGFSRWCA